MKKNLRFVLALTLGLATTVSAQDWSVDSRTRVNSTEDMMSTEQRVRAAVEFGGEAVSVYAEINSAATLGSFADLSTTPPSKESFTNSLRQAYATTNLMDFASLTAGRMALNFGSGRILGDNNWVQGNGNTWDGFLFGINNDFADVHVGYASTNNEGMYDGTTMYANIGKDMGAMGFNLLYVNTTEDVSDYDETSMGLDASYAMDNVATLSLGYYTNDDGTTEMDLTTLGVSYGVNDDLTVHAGYDMYGENGFYLQTGSFGKMYGSGMDYTAFNSTRGECTDMSFGGSYAMGDFMIGATMHTISDEDEAAGDAFEDISVMDISLGYSLSDNSSISVNYVSTDESGDDETMTWISLSVGF